MRSGVMGWRPRWLRNLPGDSTAVQDKGGLAQGLVTTWRSRTTTMGWGCWERATEGKGCYAVLAPFICSSAVGGWADSKVWTGELATPDAEQAVWRRGWGRRLQAEQAAPSLRGCVR